MKIIYTDMKQSDRFIVNPYPVVVQNAILNTPGAEILPNGNIKLQVSRYQKPEQGGSLSVRTGVFYLPELKSPYQRHYKGGTSYGGSQYISGTIVVKHPYILRAGTGGLGPEKAFIELYGKDVYKELNSDIFAIISRWNRSRYDTEEMVQELLVKWEGDEHLTYDIVRHSTEGNRLRYALQEHIIAHKLRDKGYDSVISYSTSGGNYRLSEVFDLRQMEYPDQSGFLIERRYMVTSYKAFESLYTIAKPIINY